MPALAEETAQESSTAVAAGDTEVAQVEQAETINTPEVTVLHTDITAPRATDAVGSIEIEAIPAVASAESLIPTKFQARIERHSADEIYELLTRAEKIAAGQDEYSTEEPVILVLSGEEIELFKRENYRDHKPLVDLAARLDAFNIIDVKVCNNWMAQRGIELTDLPPFVDNVPVAQQEAVRLEKAGYAYF
ncbi:MAG: intracellular sulfur oxidation DsrE/DsrF family protein [Thalassolituus sp.]|jgi:intracellular sulfur oxidation DsrE/DsrF family protein